MAYGMAQAYGGGFKNPAADSRRKLMEQLGYAAPPPASPAPVQPMARASTAPAAAVPMAPQAPAAPMRQGGGMQAEGYVPPLARESAPYQARQQAQGGAQSYWDGLDEDQKRELTQYINLLYSMPDFKGRHEQNQGLIALKANELRNRKKDALGLDYHGTAKIGDQFDLLRDQLRAQMAASGRFGSGVEYGALSNLFGREGAAIGDYVSAQDEAARDRADRERMQERQLLMQILMGNVQRNNQEQNDPGFWGDVLGIGGSILGSVL